MKGNRRVSLWNVLLVMTAIVFLAGCPHANKPPNQAGDAVVSSEELKGVWELVIATNQQTTNIFLYFDGTKMYSAVKAGEQFVAVPAGTSFWEYKDGKLQYGVAGTMVEYIGKKKDKNIELYAKVNGTQSEKPVYILKPSTVNKDSIKNAGNSGGNEQPGSGEISNEGLKGVWELVIAANQQTTNIFLYFDGTKMYSAVKAGEQFISVPAGTPFLEYKDGKLQYGVAGTMVEYIGKKNGKNIDLYAKVNGQPTSIVTYTLKPSTVSSDTIKNAGNSGGNEQPGGQEISSEELKGVWEFAFMVTPPTPVPFKLLVYFDGDKMYAAALLDGTIIPLPEGTPFLEYKNGKLQYGIAGTMVEFIGKKNGENIDLYAKANGQVSPTPVYTLKPSTESAEAIKEAGSDEPCTGPCIRSILLTPGRLAYNSSTLTVTAVLQGKNFDLIASQPDTTVKAGIFDEEGVLQGSLVTAAVIDTVNHRATVTLTAPNIGAHEATLTGKKYTVRVKLCGTYAKVKAPLVIAKEARLTENPVLEKAQIPSSEVTASTTVKMTVKGVNLALAVPAIVQLYTAAGVEYGVPVVINTLASGIGEVLSFEAAIPVPKDEGVYTAKVLFGGEVQSRYYSDPANDYGQSVTYPSLHVYGRPKFTSFSIPNAGTGKEDSSLTARVTGVNFKAPGVSEASFTVSCADKPSIVGETVIKVLSDRELTVTLTIPGAAGNYNVKIASGGENQTGTFRVKDYGNYSEYQAGSIVLKDGSIVAKNNYTEIAADNPPTAVVIGTQNVYGVPLGIGLHTKGGLRWAKDGSPGYNKKFEGIVCTPSKTGVEAAETATFTGDADGSDNWEYICSQDAAGSGNAQENYPAFHWVNEYGSTYNTGTQNWYLPSLAELCEVYKNRAVINETLAKIHGLDSNAADSGLGTDWYWSSSQSASFDSYAWQVFFNFGNVDYNSKYVTNRVCCLTGF